MSIKQDIKPFILAHIFILAISNYLVQFPFTLFGYHLTYGAITFPLIFITTDIAVLTYGQTQARLVIYKTMFPALLLSYFLSTVFDNGYYQGVYSLFNYHPLAIRIAISCFITYISSQILDIIVFQKIRKNSNWFWAPAVSTTVSNFVDSVLFFSIAFYKCSDPILSAHWPEIATIEFVFKAIISIICFMPVYLGILKYAGLNPAKELANA